MTKRKQNQMRLLRPVLVALTPVVLTLLMLGCGHSKEDESELDIINGTGIAQSAMPAVVPVVVCSGTFVSETTILTAAHCFTEAPNNTGAVLVDGKYVKPSKVFVHGNFAAARKRGDLESENDLAVIVYPRKLTTNYLSLTRIQPKVDDPVTMFGYGCNEFEKQTGAFEELRRGTNQIGKIGMDDRNRSVILSAGPRGVMHQQQSGAATIFPGDSGGPLTIRGQLAGVASTVADVNIEGEKLLISVHANVLAPSNQEFLRKAMAEGARINGLL